jgi:hypothetical protein
MSENLKKIVELLDELSEEEIFELMEHCNNKLRVESVFRDATLLDEKRKLDNI